MKQKNIILLGSTGSIGTSTLDIVREHPNLLKIKGLVANKSWELLGEQAEEFNPEFVVLADKAAFADFKKMYPHIKAYQGFDVIADLTVDKKPDLVVNALVGAKGLLPTVEALKNGIQVAIANKETLVVAGKLVTELAKSKNMELLPIDSEHSAIWQCLRGENSAEVRKIILTASGGPFRATPIEELRKVTVEKALDHPNWDMGPKITIDSSTMFNKGLEVIEAYWLYGVSPEQIEVVIHKESIIHSMVEFNDGSVKAQMGIPDMKIPIAYALFYPSRKYVKADYMDFTNPFSLHFEPPDYGKFRALKMAFQVLNAGGTYSAVLNAANEVAVAAFLQKRIGYLNIADVVEYLLQNHKSISAYTLEDVLEVDRTARSEASEYINKIEGTY